MACLNGVLTNNHAGLAPTSSMLSLELGPAGIVSQRKRWRKLAHCSGLLLRAGPWGNHGYAKYYCNALTYPPTERTRRR